jgi:hypothetical protein
MFARWKMPRRLSGIRHPYLLLTTGLLTAVTMVTVSVFVFINSNRVWLKHHQSNMTPLDQLGRFLSGMSLFLAVLVAWTTAFIVTWNNVRMDHYLRAVNSFRSLYEVFWRQESCSLARRWIISSDEYGKVLKPVLNNRNRSKLNDLADDQGIEENVRSPMVVAMTRRSVAVIVLEGLVMRKHEKGAILASKVVFVKRPESISFVDECKYIGVFKESELEEEVSKLKGLMYNDVKQFGKGNVLL